MTAMLRVRRRLAALLAVPLAAACGDTAAPPVPTSLAPNTPPPATAVVGSSLTTSVKVLDDKGKPMKGIAVTFEPSAGGSVAAAQATTDATGVATNSWTLATVTGENTLVARSGQLTPVTFSVNAQADVAANMVAATGNPTSGTVGSVLNPAPGVKLTDRHGNPVQGALVTFSGPGAVLGTQQTTNAEGIARPANWTLGGLVGVQNLRATSGNLTVLLPVTATAGPPTAILAVSGNQQNAAPGATLPQPLSVRVTDAFSNPIAGVQVTFAVTTGGGTLSGTTAVTDAGGNATSGAWRLGPVSGVQTVTATMPGGNGVTFTATAVDPALRTMTRFAGDGTTCPVSSTDCLFAVVVRDGLDRPIQGETVTWTNGTQTQVSTTNAQGRATVANLVTSATPGAAQQRARLMSTGQEIVFNYQFVATGNFNIELRFIVAPTGAQMTAFTQAKERWQQVITGDIAPWTLNEPARSCGPVSLPAFTQEQVDDLVIYVQVDSIDGPGQVLGAAGPCYVRPQAGFPILGVMRLDRADLANMESNGTLRDVITHEMGHVLGIGSLWQYSAFTHLLVGAGGDDPHFVGQRALPSFQLTGGILNNGVPVENSGGQGTRDSHWRESTFSRELMTGFINSNGLNPLSIITIGSLMDMGYQVNFGAADNYVMTNAIFGVRADTDIGSSFRLSELPMPRPMVAR